jgi:hypothetical protein
MQILVADNAGVQEVRVSDVISAEYVPLSLRASATTAAITLRGNDAHGLIRLVAFDAPFDPGGIPAAIATGKLILTFPLKGAAGKIEEVKREFLVYNDRLLQDIAYPQTFYHAFDGFAKAVSMLR